MANAVYPEYKEFLLSASANVSLTVNDTTDGPFCALVDTGTYTYNSAHDFYNDLSGIVGTDQRISTPTVANGTFDGDNLTYTAVSGNSVEALVIYRKNSGANTTWKLVLFLDTSVTGLPVTPNGGDITVAWNASGIFTISDRRMKTNIRLVGEYGELGIYEYSYIGEDRARLGFMADEVEKLDKGAVVDFGSHKRVDYHRAIAAADRLAA
jgi:hypothetical protein